MNNSSISTTEKKSAVKIFLIVILLSNFFRNLGSSIVDIGLPNFILGLSGELVSYGLVVAIFSVTQSLFQFPIASISDKYGRKLMISIGMSVYILGTLLCFIAETIPQLILFRAVQGAGAYSSILQAMTGEQFDKNKQGKAMALYSFSLSLGYFGGIVIGGQIAYFFNFRLVFLISGTLAFISFILILAFFKKPNKIISSKEDILIKSEENLKNLFNNIKILAKDRQFLLTVILNSMRWMIMNGSVVYLIWIFEVQWGLNQIETSFLFLFIILIFLFAILLGGRIVDRFGSKKILLTSQLIMITSGIFFITLALLSSFIIFYIACFITAIGLAFFQTAGNTQISNVIEKEKPELKGSGFGINNTIGFFCGAIGPIFVSYLGTVSIYFPFYIITFIVFLTLILTLKYIAT